MFAEYALFDRLCLMVAKMRNRSAIAFRGCYRSVLRGPVVPRKIGLVYYGCGVSRVRLSVDLYLLVRSAVRYPTQKRLTMIGRGRISGARDAIAVSRGNNTVVVSWWASGR
jgi:hypothetical protein